MKDKPCSLDQWLTKNEIEQPRTADEYIRWINEKLDITRESEGDFRKQLFLHEGIAKDFYEELFPLYRLLKKKTIEWQKAKFKPVIGGHSHYDVIVESSINGIPKYIEITDAHFDECEKARMECFCKYKRISCDGKVMIIRHKKNSPPNLEDFCEEDTVLYKDKATIIVNNDALISEETYNQIMQKIKNSINKKIHKDIKRIQNTALLVYFNDNTIRYNDKICHNPDIFRENINDLYSCLFRKFSALYIVGSSGDLFFERNHQRQ